MRLFLTSIFCSLALWTPAGADDPPCIDGFQTFPKKHVLGAADTLCADTEEECKQACAERTDCAAVDFNFGRNPWEGNRCWMHNVETLAASPMKTNRRTNHIVKCTEDEEHSLAVGPAVDEPVDGYFGIVEGSTQDVPVIWTGFDTEYPEQEIVGLRANIHKSPGSKVRLYVLGVEKIEVADGINYYAYRFGIRAYMPENGISTLFVNDSAFETSAHDLVMRPGMYLEIMALSESEGDGVGYRNRDANCQSLTFTRPSNKLHQSFGDAEQKVEWDMDIPCKEIALQLLYSPTDTTLP